MSEITYTKVGNTITVSSTYIQNLGAVNRLGSAQIEFTTPTVQMQEDIFFKFYLCNDSGAEKIYTELNIEAATALDMERVLTMVFLNYYNDSTVVDELSLLGNSFEPLAERLQSVVTPTTPLASDITMPANTTNYVEFVGMGLGSWVGAYYINGGVTGRTKVWGNRVAQVHITTTDPLGPAPIEALYDNTDLGCWTFNRFGVNGVIVYTNLTGGAFTPSQGLGHWGQVLCVWPIVSRILNAQYACMFNNLDQSFMRNGLSYFPRSTRKDTYYGWAGNYIQSIFNDWGIPVISPIWSMSDLALATYMTYGGLGDTDTNNKGVLTDQTKNYRFVGPVASNNIASIKEKTVRSSLPLLWANECRRGASASGSSIPSFSSTVLTTLGYSTVGDYIAACLSGVQQGYNAHLYRYMLQDRAQTFFVPTQTRGYITSGVSWSGTLASQPSLLGVFTNAASSYPKYYKKAVTDFFPSTAGTYGAALIARIQDGVLIVVQAMGAGDEALLEGWVYTP